MILSVHLQKRGYMKGFFVAETLHVVFCGKRRRDAVATPKHVAVTLAPRSVVNLRYDRFGPTAGAVEAVIKVERAEVVAPVPQLCEQADGPLRSRAGFVLDQLPHRFLQRLRGVANVIAATE